MHTFNEAPQATESEGLAQGP